jgi:hypothetical protein
MNRLFACLAVLGLAAAGCSDLPTLHSDQAVKAKAPATEPAPPKPPAQPSRAVNADQVNEGNARSMAQALLEELDRDEQAAAAPAAGPTPVSGGPKR